MSVPSDAEAPPAPAPDAGASHASTPEAGAPPAGAGRRRVLAAGLVFVVTLGALLLGVLLGVPDDGADDDDLLSVTCPASRGYHTTCLDVDGLKLRADLQARGFTCKDRNEYLTCAIQTKFRNYQVDINLDEAGRPATTSVSASMYAEGVEFDDRSLNLLVWTAGLPLLAFPGDRAQVEDWVRRTAVDISSGGSSTAKIAGLEYTLRQDSLLGARVSLSVRTTTL